MTTILPTTREHVDRLLSIGLRADVASAFEAAGVQPEDAVLNAFEESTRAWTLIDADGAPVAIWGVHQWQGQAGIGVPWFVASDAASDHAFTLVRRARDYILEMGKEFPVLSNFVDARNLDAMGWLKDAGFRFDTAMTLVGPKRSPFLQFGVRIPPHAPART